jgi:hypothetical protein
MYFVQLRIALQQKFMPRVTLCPPIGGTGFIAQCGCHSTDLFIATSTVNNTAQTYSFITIF